MPAEWHEERQPGFRLARFEVYNWGTFNARVWKIEPGGANALLTGDIGSGKSTLVDALTTLLVSPRKITYNKAAGADARERTLHSYVRGEYRSVSNELTGGAQAQALRGEDSYSVAARRVRGRVSQARGDPRPGLLVEGRRAQPGPLLHGRCRRALYLGRIHRVRRRHTEAAQAPAGEPQHRDLRKLRIQQWAHLRLFERAPEIYEVVLNADSAGEFVNLEIKPNYDDSEVE